MEMMYGICCSGNYIYWDSNKKLLKPKENDGNGHATYILMQMIFRPIHLSYLVRGGIYQQGETVSELGIFGAYLWYGILSWDPFFKLKCHCFGTKIIKHVFHGLFA